MGRHSTARSLGVWRRLRRPFRRLVAMFRFAGPLGLGDFARVPGLDNNKRWGREPVELDAGAPKEFAA